MKTKKLPYGEKAPRVRALLSAYPDKSDKEIAREVGCHATYVMHIRHKEYAQELRVLEADGLMQVEPEAQGVDAILEERGSRYGPFITHAEITQKLKMVAEKYLHNAGKELKFDQKEALDMIFHKIGRIINGDPDYADSWVDIAGYAKLVADRLEGKVR